MGGQYGWYVGCAEGGSVVFFVKGVFLGYFYGIFLGKVNGCELRSSVGVLLVAENGPWLGDLEGFLVGNFEWNPAG